MSIFTAICNRDFRKVQRIVKTNPKCVNIKNKCQWTPLDVAIAEGKLKIAQFLFEKGGRPNLKNYRSNKCITTPVSDAAYLEDTATLEWVFTEKILPLRVLNIKTKHKKSTPLDIAIRSGNLEMAQFLFEKGGRPNLEKYRDKKWNPVLPTKYFRHRQHAATLKWAFTEKVLPLSALNHKNWRNWTPLDNAIAFGKTEIAQCLWEMGGRPNLDEYCNGKYTPVHHTTDFNHRPTLKWIFTEKVLPPGVLNLKDYVGRTPLYLVNCWNWKTKTFFQRLIHVDPVFLAMQRAKRDHECVLRRLPNELLDMVVDEVASRFHLVVEWYE